MEVFSQTGYTILRYEKLLDFTYSVGSLVHNSFATLCKTLAYYIKLKSLAFGIVKPMPLFDYSESSSKSIPEVT